MSPEDRNQDLSTLLRRGDPAADGSELRRNESASLRRTVLLETSTSTPIRWLPLAGAALAAVLAAAFLLPRTGSIPAIPTALASVPSAECQASNPASSRQIRFATERGTQIIWVLDPNLDL